MILKQKIINKRMTMRKIKKTNLTKCIYKSKFKENNQILNMKIKVSKLKISKIIPINKIKMMRILTFYKIQKKILLKVQLLMMKRKWLVLIIKFHKMIIKINKN